MDLVYCTGVNSHKLLLNTNKLVNKVCRYMCRIVYLWALLYTRVQCLYSNRGLKDGIAFADRRSLPLSLSIIPSGAPLLAIISPVRSPAGRQPHHISLCQSARCLWIDPWSMKLCYHYFQRLLLFQPKTPPLSPLILKLVLICLIRHLRKSMGISHSSHMLPSFLQLMCFIFDHLLNC